MPSKHCGNGECLKPGILRCAKCKRRFYCTKACQKEHWKKHKLLCRVPEVFPSFLPGVFDFLGLPRELRNKIYEELVVAVRSPEEQSEYEKLAALHHEPDPERKRFKRMDELDVRLMIVPGSTCYDVSGCEALSNVNGLSFANKQIRDELMTTFFSKNGFLVYVDETRTLHWPGQFLGRKMNPAHLAQIKHLYIDVETKLQPFENDYHRGIAVVKDSMNHIIDTLNSIREGLKSLTVNHLSCYGGEIQELRRDADILAARRDVRNIQVMRPDGDVQELDTDGIKEVFLHGNHIADAIINLSVPVKNFLIFGDISGKDIERSYHKFGVIYDEVDEDEGHRDKNGQKRDQMELTLESMAAASLKLQHANTQAHHYATRPVKTARVSRFDGGAMIIPGSNGAPLNFPHGILDGGQYPTVHPPR